jgi:hypothetical protein
MRTLVIIALIGIVAVVVLGLIAKRFASMAEPMLSVDEVIAQNQATPDLQPDIDAGVMDSEVPSITNVDDASAPEVSKTEDPDPAVVDPAVVDPAVVDPGAVDPGAVDPAALKDVDDFIAIRSSYLSELEERPAVFHQMKVEIDDKMSEQNRNPMHLDATVELVLSRRIKMAERGMSLEKYRHVRESFRGLMSGEGAVDPVLLPAFAQRKDQLEPIWLGVYEAADL